MLKHLNASRNLLIVAVAATVLVVATSGAANAAKRVCYKDPGRGMVCEVVK